MRFNQLIKYLNNSEEEDTFDPFWNQVILFLRFSSDLSSNEVLKGLPFHYDYSKYQRRCLKYDSTNPAVNISYSNDQPIPSQPEVQSYLNLNNRLVRNQRIAEINEGGITKQFSEVRACYLAVQPGQARDFQLGTSDFTIDITFKIDEITPVALGNQFQCLFSIGTCLRQTYTEISDELNTILSNGTGYGLYIENRNLVFIHDGERFVLNNQELDTNTWYSFGIQRKEDTLQSFLNGTLQREHEFNRNLVYPSFSNRQGIDITTVKDTFLQELHIGADPVLLTTNFSGYVENTVDTAFSGSISNFRITEAARYLNNNYIVKLPYYNALRENALDPEYSNVLHNAPYTFDLFDYSQEKKHFKNKEYLYRYPMNISTGGLILDGTGVQETEVIPKTLDEDEWTLEFYLLPFLNGSPYIPYYRRNLSLIFFDTIGEFLERYNVFSAYQQSYLSLSHSILKITDEEDKNILDIFSNIHYIGSSLVLNSASHYLSIKFSNNGTDYITFGSEAGIDLADSTAPGYSETLIPADQISFLYSPHRGDGFGYVPDELSTYTGFLRAEHENPLHIAIQKYLNSIYFFVNGQLSKTVFYNGTFHSGSGLKIKVNSNFEEMVGNLDGQAYRVQLGIKGLRLTNKARYSISATNNVHSIHSLQPLRLVENAITPPRARVIDIIRKSISEVVSLEEVEWYVFLSVPVDGLTLNKFTLTQIEGIQDAELVSIEKITEYQYIVKANTGTGNGRLTLNFVDDNTVLYKNSSISIGNYIGELSFEGETYRINKSAPQPILTSGASPYINGSFRVQIRFDSALTTFNPEKIGVVNGFISNIKIIDEILKIYDFLVTPIKEDPVIIQALPGAGVTDNGLLSLASEPLVRIFSKSFPILQLPLNIPSFTNDFSPSRLTLQQTVPNSLVHSSSIAPTGAGSSIHVKPFDEQSGLFLNNFKAIDTNFDSYTNNEWTIEWFYRGDTTGGGITHLFTVQNQATGFSVLMENGKLKIQRSMEAPTNLFPELDVDERVTSSFVAWDDTSFTNLQKYPHFAITKKGNVYRFYVNGARKAILSSLININITQGNLFVGYYPNRVNDREYYLSNLRFTYGRALYTSATVAVPFVPFPILPDITESTNLLNYISIYSNNAVSTVAKENDKIIVYFSSIIPLAGTPVVQINNIEADVIKEPYNSYRASITVDNSLNDGQAVFNITIPAQPGIPETSFSSTTNGTFVVVDKTAISSTFSTENPNDDRPIVDVLVNFTEEPYNLTKNSFTVANSFITDFYLDARNKFCTFKLNALSTGDMSVRLLEGAYTDLAGNPNVASTVFTRSVVVPNIVPDTQFDNVICLIQPISNNTIQDLSSNNASIVNNGVTVTTDVSPAGLTRSMAFNGINSSLDIDLGQTLTSTTPYTIEMFVYMPSNTLFRLTSPIALPATDVSSTAFRANWTEIEEADRYLIDISPNPLFNNYLPGYKNREVETGYIFVGNSQNNISSPIALFSNYVGTKGFVSRWSKQADSINTSSFVEGYKLDVSLSKNFTTKLEGFSNLFTEDLYKVIGKQNDLTFKAEPLENSSSEDSDNSLFNEKQGVLLTSLFSNTTFPKLFYVLEESSIRYYAKDGYTLPAIAEDIDLFQWNHIAIVNRGKYSYLYVNGELRDRTYAASYNENVSTGYSIGGFKGNITGLRITKGYPRYTDNTYTVPRLPFYYE